ncbi:MAG: hypothetical protein ABJD11_15450 [Gemmatimonadota bacterium]
MTFKPSTWQPIAVALSVINLVATGLAAGAAEPWHAAAHATLALAFGLWAQRLGQGSAVPEFSAALESLEIEVSKLRAELTETQERLDFAERVLAQRPEPIRVKPEH